MTYCFYHVITLLVFGSWVISAQQEPTFYFEKGMEHLENRSLDSALYYFNKAIDADSMFHQAYFRRAALKGKLFTVESAIEDLSKAIEIQPSPLYFNNRGINRAILGQYDEAVADYDEAIRLDSAYAHAHLNKGASQYYLGNYEHACTSYYRAYELGFEMAKPFLEEECGYNLD